jgi:hypothetical protein
VPLRVQFAVKRPDEARVRTGGFSHIPTLGHPATAWDNYRSVAVESDDPRLVNTCITDIHTLEGFCRVYFGQVRDYQDIEAAELALQAFLFHEDIQIIVPTAKVEVAPASNGQIPFFSYLRPDKGVRPQACFDLFQQANSCDWLCAVDYLYSKENVIYGQLDRSQALVGQRLEQALTKIPNPTQTQLIGRSVAIDLKVPGYFFGTDSLTTDNFVTRLYERVAISLEHNTKAVPTLGLNIHVPPLLAIVLHRASNRNDLPAATVELRSELDRVRAELCEFDHMVRTEESQQHLEKKCREIEEAFAAIVADSRLDRGARTLGKIWSLNRPVRSAYNIATNPTALSPEALSKLMSEIQSAVTQNLSLVDRTITSAMFSRLLRTDNNRKLLAKHFTDSEIKSLDRSK